MSFLKKLFGGGDKPAMPAPITEYKGFEITPTPYPEGGQHQTCGVIARVINGERKEHRFVRADKHASKDEAVDFSIAKARQIIDEQGDRLFS